MRFRVGDVLLPLAAVAVSFAFAIVDSASPWDAVFLAVLLTCVFLLVRLLWRAIRQARTAKRLERESATVRPTEAARRAASQERSRLSAEIDLSVRRSLERVARLAEEAHSAEDPLPLLMDIQAEARQTMTELRRQLGLIVDVHPSETAIHPHVPSERAERRDLLTAAFLIALVLCEHVLFTGLGTTSLVTSIAFAAATARRSRAPVACALAATGVLAIGVVLALPVGDGFALGAGLGLLVWSLLTGPVRVRSTAAAVVLGVVAVASRLVNEPANAPLLAVTTVVIGVLAVIVGRVRRMEQAAHARARMHRTAVAAAQEEASRAERATLARDLHDVASHAVSLVAVQAGAAELAWERDPVAARAMITSLRATIADALRELGTAQRGGVPATSWADILRLIDRVERAGVRIRLMCPAPLPERATPTAYRVVQEALTNVLRHAPGASATIAITMDPGQVHVEVADDGPGPDDEARGYGLAGLADRVGAAGGTLQAGPRRGGGFLVRATLPINTAVVT